MALGIALLAVACSCLLAGSQAKPLGLEYTYKCCRESLLSDSNEFKAAEGVSSLEACKEFCKTNNYGSPIYGMGGWQCTTSKNFLCREVERTLCPDDITQSQGYYRYYPTASLVRVTDSITRNLTTSNTSRLNIDDISEGDSRRVILGGRTVGDFTTSELGSVRVEQSGTIITNRDTDVVRTANFEGNINVNDLGGVLRASGTGSITIETVRNRFNGSRREVDDTETGGRRTFNTIQDLSRDGNSDLFRRETSDNDREVGRVTSVQQRTGGGNTTSVSVTGGSQLSAEAFFGSPTPLSESFRGSNTNLTASRSRSGERIVSDSLGAVADIRKTTDTSLRLVQGADGSGLLRRTTITSTNTNSRDFVIGGDRQLDSERKVLSRDDLGAIDQTTNKSTDATSSVADLRGTTDRLLLVNTTRECPTCISQNNESLRRRTVSAGVEKAISQAEETDVNTVTRADNRELVVRGTTGTRTNNTQLDLNTEGAVEHRITNQAEADCDRSKGTCSQQRNMSRVRVVTSNNSTSSQDVSESKKSRIFIGNY